MAKKKRVRNYKREYVYHATDEQKTNRATRNGARRKKQAARKKAGLRPLKTTEEVHHTRGIKKKSTRVVSRRANRKAGSPGRRKR